MRDGLPRQNAARFRCEFTECLLFRYQLNVRAGLGMPRKTIKSGKWRLLGVLAAACCSMAIGVGALIPYRQELSARYWDDELSGAPDERVGEVVKELATLDEPGIKALARALGSSRSIVSESAYQALSEEINACARLTSLDANDRMSALAAALAAAAEQSPAARGAAARLVVRMLLWPGESGLRRSGLVAECERVLQAAGAPPAAHKSAAPAAPRSAARPPRTTQQPAMAPQRSDGEILAHLATADLPFADLAPPGLSRAVTEKIAEPARFDDTDTAAMADPTSNEAGQVPNGESALAGLSPVSPAKHERESESERLKALDSLSLFAQLHESDEAAAEAAAELQSRGLSIRQIEVGMHLCSSDAHERRMWTEYLPGIRGVSAKAWLLHLSRDESVGVRRAAMNLLATSSDPEMLRRVGELSREDSDADLRLEAARAIELLNAPAP